MKVLLDSKKVQQAVERLTEQIAAGIPAEQEIAIIGIRSRGEVLAQRLADDLSKVRDEEIPCGTLDITLYRDDLNSPGSIPHPTVQTTEIGFDIEDKIIILVDDVLYTGRSVRAAITALLDLGRPRAIRLAVLVDRTIGREFPIQADFTGCKTDMPADKTVQVHLRESDGQDQVVVE
jgi:pyrimidine operon attenuation protein / uracil phosphoribosyltransferase